MGGSGQGLAMEHVVVELGLIMFRVDDRRTPGPVHRYCSCFLDVSRPTMPSHC